MFTERSGKQNRLEMVVLEELVPRDHLLRKIDATVDFSFINKICKPYYCENNGRPAMIVIGVAYKSELAKKITTLMSESRTTVMMSLIFSLFVVAVFMGKDSFYILYFLF